MKPIRWRCIEGCWTSARCSSQLPGLVAEEEIPEAEREQEHRRQATCPIIDPRPRNNNILSGILMCRAQVHRCTLSVDIQKIYRRSLFSF